MTAIDMLDLPFRKKADAILQRVTGARELPEQPSELLPDLVCVVEQFGHEQVIPVRESRQLVGLTHVKDIRAKRWLIVPATSVPDA